MKEATGELNMTVITVVAVVAVGAFFTIFVLPGLKDSISSSTICANGANYKIGKTGKSGYVSCSPESGGTYKCNYAVEVSNKGTISIKTSNVTCDTN